MTAGQRARYLKYGGILAFVIFVLFLISAGEREDVKNLVKSETLLIPMKDTFLIYI